MGLKLQHRVLKSGLPHRHRLLALTLALHAHDEDGSNIKVRVKTLRRELAVHRTQVFKGLRALEDLGILIPERVGGGRHRCNLYRFNADALPPPPKDHDDALPQRNGSASTTLSVSQLGSANGSACATGAAETVAPALPVGAETVAPALPPLIKPVRTKTSSTGKLLLKQARPLLPSPPRPAHAPALEGVVVDDRADGTDAFSTFVTALRPKAEEAGE